MGTTGLLCPRSEMGMGFCFRLLPRVTKYSYTAVRVLVRVTVRGQGGEAGKVAEEKSLVQSDTTKYEHCTSVRKATNDTRIITNLCSSWCLRSRAVGSVWFGL